MYYRTSVLVTGPSASAGARYSQDHHNRTPPLTVRTYQILPHTNSYFHCLHSYQTTSGSSHRVPGALCPPWGAPGAPEGEGLDSCKDGESSCEYGVGSGRYGGLGGDYDYYEP